MWCGVVWCVCVCVCVVCCGVCPTALVPTAIGDSMEMFMYSFGWTQWRIQDFERGGGGVMISRGGSQDFEKGKAIGDIHSRLPSSLLNISVQ